DYELNIRLRQAGGLVWFDPSLAVEYRPRGSFGAVAQQYFNYGRWKAVVLRRHPGSLRLRQLVPPMAIGAVVVAAVLGSRWRRLWVVPVGYVTVVAGALRRPSAVLAAITVHISWAAGLLGQSTRSFRQRLQSRASTDSA
ncbi:MAG: glycosyltransferase family 2 protein, partial [Actinomycetota bacterium]